MTDRPEAAGEALAAVPTEPDTARLLDVRRTDLHYRFFHTFHYKLASELLHDLERLSLDCNAFAGSSDALRSGYRGWLYWLFYLKGYTQYRLTGVIDVDNLYYRYLTLRYAAHDADPTMRYVSSTAAGHIMRRYEDCDQFSQPAIATQFAEEVLEPVTVFVRNPAAGDDNIGIYEVGSADPIQARLVDGHHRLFAARLFGVKRVRFRVRVEQRSVPDIPGQIEYIGMDGNRLRMRGWAAPPSGAAHSVEVRTPDRTICRAAVQAQSQLAVSTAENGVQRRFTFTVDTEVPFSMSEREPLDVMVLVDWLPVGKLTSDPSRRMQP